MQLNAPAVNLDKGLTNDKYDILLQTFYSYLMNTDETNMTTVNQFIELFSTLGHFYACTEIQ